MQTQFTYDPCGNPTTTGTASQYPFLFRGMEYDATGLYYGGGVYYSPNLGRPLQQVTPGGPGGGQGGINASFPSSQGGGGGLSNAGISANLGIGAGYGLLSYFGGSLAAWFFGVEAWGGPIAWAATAVGLAVAALLDLFGFDLFGGGSPPFVPPGTYRSPHYVASQFIGCEALTPNMDGSFISESAPVFEGLEIGALLNPVVLGGAVVTVGTLFFGWKFYTHFTKGGKKYIGIDRIERDYAEYVSGQRLSFRKFKSRCDWLKENGSRYSRGEFKKAARQWGCQYRNN
jgi:hypothetical protein